MVLLDIIIIPKSELSALSLHKDIKAEHDFKKEELKVYTNVEVDDNNKTVQEIEKELKNSDEKCIPYSKFMHVCLYGKNGYYSDGKVRFKEH